MAWVSFSFLLSFSPKLSLTHSSLQTYHGHRLPIHLPPSSPATSLGYLGFNPMLRRWRRFRQEERGGERSALLAWVKTSWSSNTSRLTRPLSRCRVRLRPVARYRCQETAETATMISLSMPTSSSSSLFVRNHSSSFILGATDSLHRRLRHLPPHRPHLHHQSLRPLSVPSSVLLFTLLASTDASSPRRPPQLVAFLPRRLDLLFLLLGSFPRDRFPPPPLRPRWLRTANTFSEAKGER
jgi:hypothetical protein